MRVEELMQSEVRVCHRNASLADVSQLMWEGDLGAVPVVDEERRPVGMITDRDICMAAYFSGRPTGEITVDSVNRTTPATIGRDDTIEDAMKLMRERRVRRLPVVDQSGVLAGMISLGDLALKGGGYREDVAKTLETISEPHSGRTQHLLRSAGDGATTPEAMTRETPRSPEKKPARDRGTKRPQAR